MSPTVVQNGTESVHYITCRQWGAKSSHKRGEMWILNGEMGKIGLVKGGKRTDESKQRWRRAK